MRNFTRHFIFLLLIAYCTLLIAHAQAPTIETIDPPNWWKGMSINPVRVLLRGTNLNGATVVVPAGSGGLRVGNLKYSENGHYLFF